MKSKSITLINAFLLSPTAAVRASYFKRLACDTMAEGVRRRKTRVVEREVEETDENPQGAVR